MTPLTMARHVLRAELHDLGVYSDQPSRLADFYTAALGYRFDAQGGGMMGSARGRRLAILPGKSRALAHAAYAVPDVAELQALEQRLMNAAVIFERVDHSGFKPGAIAVNDPDGNRFVFGLAATCASSVASPAADREARLQHVVFASTDVHRLLSFFTDVFGFQLTDRVNDDAGGLRTAFVRCSHEHHSLALFAADENRLDHHCYEVDDWNAIRDWSDLFAKQRMPLKWGPGRHGPGNNLFVFLHDPDGNWLELSAELEHVASDRPVAEWPHEEYTLNNWGMGLLRS